MSTKSKSGNLESVGIAARGAGKFDFGFARFDLAWAGESVYSAGKMQLDGVTVAYWRGDATRATRGTPRKLEMRAHRAPPSEPTRKASFTIRFIVDRWNRSKYIFFFLTISLFFYLLIVIFLDNKCYQWAMEIDRKDHITRLEFVWWWNFPNIFIWELYNKNHCWQEQENLVSQTDKVLIVSSIPYLKFS